MHVTGYWSFTQALDKLKPEFCVERGSALWPVCSVWTGGMDTMTSNFVATGMRQYGLYNTILPPFFLCLLDSNAEKPASVAEQEGSQHIKYQRMWTRALTGEFKYTGYEKWLPHRLYHLVPLPLCGLLKRLILNCSIFPVTAWFHIHNRSVVWLSNSISVYRQITCLDPVC